MGNIEPSCKRRPIAGLKSWWPPWGKKRYLLQNMACTTITKWDQSTRFLVRWRWTPRRAWITLPRIWIRWYILSVHNGFTLIVWMPYIIKPCESIQWVVYIYIYIYIVIILNMWIVAMKLYLVWIYTSCGIWWLHFQGPHEWAHIA